jgi:hypothetical protein
VHPISVNNDWINLKTPEHSRILRAPLAKGKNGFGVAWCRERNVDASRKRIHLLRHGYRHAVQSLGAFPRREFVAADRSGKPVATFASTADPSYRAMLDIIRRGRRQVLATPRVDMPGAQTNSGTCRLFVPPRLPESLPPLDARVDADGVVRLSWQRSAETIGLSAEVHRGATGDFLPDQGTLLATTMLFEYSDADAPRGWQHYAVILRSDSNRSEPIRAAIEVPSPPPPTPKGLNATADFGRY